MACFDPSILLCLPLEQANFCFSALYQSFSLRGWLEGSPENDCRDEYLDFIGHFRQAYHSLKDAPNGIPDMINLLSSMPELRNRAHLYRLFQLSCMCLTENTPLLPPSASTMLTLKGQSVVWEMSFCLHNPTWPGFMKLYPFAPRMIL